MDSYSKIFNLALESLEKEEVIKKIEKDQSIELTEEESKSYEEQKNDLDIQNIRETLEMRKGYAKTAFKIVIAVLIGDAFFITLNGLFRLLGCSDLISDKVMMTLIGSTTASILGLVAIVLHNLFPNHNKKE